MVGPKTRSLLWFLFFLCLAEGGLRWSERQLVPEGGLPVGRPIHVVLGTSRTLRSIMPTVVAEVLVEGGIENPCVVNISDLGRTVVGLYQLYMQQLHPRLNSSLDTAVLAIEVRGSGLNDNHLEARERAFVRQEQFDPTGQRDAPISATFDFEAVAQGLASQLALTRAGEILDRWRDPGELEVPYWMGEQGGWKPFRRPRPFNLDTARNRGRYQNELLANYKLGGIQTAYLRRLVRQAHADGWTVMLYTTPITDIHRDFWSPNDYARYRAHLQDFAREEGLRLLDFDEDHDYPLDEFFDTHHLNRKGALRFSRQYGVTYLATLFR